MIIPGLRYEVLKDENGVDFSVEWALSDMAHPPGEGGKSRLRLNTVRMWFRIPEYNDGEWKIAFHTDGSKFVVLMDVLSHTWAGDNNLDPDFKRFMYVGLEHGLEAAMKTISG